VPLRCFGYPKLKFSKFGCVPNLGKTYRKMRSLTHSRLKKRVSLKGLAKDQRLASQLFARVEQSFFNLRLEFRYTVQVAECCLSVAHEECTARLCSHTFIVGLNLDGANLGSCWCRQHARRVGQRKLSLPYAWESLLSIACLVIPFLIASAFLACMQQSC